MLLAVCLILKDTYIQVYIVKFWYIIITDYTNTLTSKKICTRIPINLKKNSGDKNSSLVQIENDFITKKIKIPNHHYSFTLLGRWGRTYLWVFRFFLLENMLVKKITCCKNKNDWFIQQIFSNVA